MPSAILIAVFVVLLVVVIAASVVRRRAAAARAADAMAGLRLQILQSTPQDLGLTVAPGEPFSIVMDMAYPGAVVSIVSAATGDASIYISNGGGVLGGIEHESVRAAATAFVQEAGRHRDHLRSTSEFPLPAAGLVRFYVGTPEGSLVGEASEQELAEGKSALSPLYAAGQNVITVLRVVTEQQNTAR